MKKIESKVKSIDRSKLPVGDPHLLSLLSHFMKRRAKAENKTRCFCWENGDIIERQNQESI
jgi:hypothetical protein